MEDSLEIVVGQSSGFSATGLPQVQKAREAFEALGTLLTDAVAPFKEKLNASTASADEIEVRLELSLQGEGKWIVVSMGASASVAVRLLWKRVQGGS